MNFLPVEIDQEYIGIAKAFEEFCANDPTLTAFERDRPDDKKNLRAFEEWHEANCEAYSEAYESAMRRFAAPLASNDVYVTVFRDGKMHRVPPEYFCKSFHLHSISTGSLAGFVSDGDIDQRFLNCPLFLKRNTWKLHARPSVGPGRRPASQSQPDKIHTMFLELISSSTFERGELTRIGTEIAKATGYKSDTVRRMIAPDFWHLKAKKQ